jgi:hypothetical protein
MVLLTIFHKICRAIDLLESRTEECACVIAVAYGAGVWEALRETLLDGCDVGCRD